jgi:rhodanese-related sulfurtransferase
MQAILPKILFLAACLGNTAKPAIGQIGVEELKQRMEAGPLVLVDVRSQREYAAGHVPKATSIPLDELPRRAGELESHRTEDVYLICAVGSRSMQAAELLSEAGFKRPINISGGTSGWKEKDFPLE